jgi:DNA polymerase-3 subunit epsilon
VKLTTGEAFPRLAAVRVPRADGGLYVGPLSSTRAARLVIDAIESVVPLHRCRASIREGQVTRAAPCAAAQLGVALCPCAGDVTAARYREAVETASRGLTGEPALLLEPLQERMNALARVERFEEAADVRDRAAALAGALFRQRRSEQLRRSGTIELDLGNGSRVELDGGRLLRAWSVGELALGVACGPPEPSDAGWLPAALADELACVASWLDRNARRVRLVRCDGTLASVLPPLCELSLRR